MQYKIYAVELSGAHIGSTITASWTGPRGGKKKLKSLRLGRVIHGFVADGTARLIGKGRIGRDWSYYDGTHQLPYDAVVTVNVEEEVAK